MSATSVPKVTGSVPANTYNVKSYGATGDGVKDDSFALQLALNDCNANGGGVVYFPEGTYLIGYNTMDDATETVVSPTDLTFDTTGDTITTAGGIDWTTYFSVGDAIRITDTASNNITTNITNVTSTVLTVDNNLTNEGTSDASATIRKRKKGGLIVYSNTTISGSGWGSIIKVDIQNYIDPSNDRDFRKMNFFRIPAGESNILIQDIQLDGSADIQSDGSIGQAGFTGATEHEGIDFQGESGSEVTDVTVRNCYIHDVPHDGIDCDYVFKGRFHNNKIVDCGYNGIHAGQQEDDISIQDNYIDNCGYQRKADAIDDLYGGVDNTADNGIVSGNTIVNCPRGVRVASGGENIIIANNVISQTANGDYAIICEAGYFQICNNVIYDNAGSSKGVQVASTAAGGVITSNTIRGTANGIDVDCSGHVDITSNIMTAGSTNYAVFMGGGAHTCVGNSVQGKPSSSTRGAYHVDADGNGSIVSNNYVTGTQAGRSIYSAADDVIITGNVCEGASSSGVEIEIAATADDNMVNHNRVTAASTNAVSITAGANRTMVTRNNFNGSTGTVSDSGTSSVVANNIA